MELSKEDKEKKEELILKMMEHKGIAGEYSKQISLIDDKCREGYVNSMIGKCFTKRCGLLRVEGYRKEDMSFIGSCVYFYGEQEYSGSMTLDLNTTIFQSSIDEGEEVTPEEFSDKIELFKSFMK